MLDIFIINLHEYESIKNNHIDEWKVGKWIELPLKEEELKKKIANISNNGKDEIFISDYETDIGITINEYDDIYKLNKIANELKSLEDYEREIVMTLLSDGYSFDDALNTKDNCILYHNCYDMEDIARKYCDDLGIVPENLERYFDYAAFGDDLGIEHKFIFNKNGNCVQVW